MHTRLFVLVAAAVAVALSPGRAFAHGLDAWVKLPPDTPRIVVVEVGFDDGMPAEKAEVVVTDAAGAVIARGETDERGVWKFEKPGAGKYIATIEAIGHKAKVDFEVAAAETEFTSWRPDRTLGVALGVGGLLAASFAFWWFRLRKSGGL